MVKLRKVKISDAELAKAAKAVRETMLDSLSEFTEHEFSASFALKMAETEKKKEYFRELNIAAKRSAAVFAVVAICVCSWLSIDTDSRITVLEWIQKVNADSIVCKHLAMADEISMNKDFNFTV